MAYIPLRNIGRGGLVPDMNPYDVDLTQFPSGNNVAFENGNIGKTLGYQDVGITIPNKPVAVSGFISGGYNSIIIGTANKIYNYNGASVSDVTGSSGTYTNTDRWQVEQMGSGVIFNNGSDVPKYINKVNLQGGNNFSDLTNWPSNVVTQSVKPYKSFLILAGYNEGSNIYKTRVKWSDEFDPTGVPASYTTSATNLSGFNELGGENGDLKDQLTLGNTNILYAENGVYAMDFIGAPLVFSFRELFSDQGIINRGACAAFAGKHLVVGTGDIYVHDGNSKKSIADLKVRNEFYKTLNDANSVFCFSDPRRSEVSICYADKYATKDPTDSKYSPNRCLVYNWTNESFTFKDIPNLRSLANADILRQGTSTGTWGDTSSSFQSATWGDTTAWWSNSSLEDVAAEIGVFAVNHTESKLQRMTYSTGFNGSAFEAALETSKIDLDSVLGTSNSTIKHIRGIMPQIKGSGTIDISVGVSDTPSDAVSWGAEKTFNIDTDNKIDVRLSGRYLAFKFCSNSSTDVWSISGMDIDVQEVSKR